MLKDYLGRPAGVWRIRTILLPALVETSSSFLTREQMKTELTKREPETDPSKAGFYLTSVSTQLGSKRNDFLRQVIKYEYPNYSWEKDNFAIREGYRELVGQVLTELSTAEPL